MTTKIVLSAPLPRVYEETGNGRVAAMAAVAGQPSTLIGGDFKVEELTRISKETVRAVACACLALLAQYENRCSLVAERGPSMTRQGAVWHSRFHLSRTPTTGILACSLLCRAQHMQSKHAQSQKHAVVR